LVRQKSCDTIKEENDFERPLKAENEKFEPGSAPDAEGYPARSVEVLPYPFFPSAAQVTFLFGHRETKQ
jgi:hypothetical protein